MAGEDELRDQRVAKAEALRTQGIDPYPPRFQTTHRLAAAAAAFEAEEARGEQASPVTVTVGGRVTAMRLMGKAAFLDLRDATGRLQLYLKRDVLGEDWFERLSLIDLGDFLGRTARSPLPGRPALSRPPARRSPTTRQCVPPCCAALHSPCR